MIAEGYRARLVVDRVNQEMVVLKRTNDEEVASESRLADELRKREVSMQVSVGRLELQYREELGAARDTQRWEAAQALEHSRLQHSVELNAYNGDSRTWRTDLRQCRLPRTWSPSKPTSSLHR